METLNELRARLQQTRMAIEAMKPFLATHRAEAEATIARLRWREQDLAFKIQRCPGADQMGAA